MEHDKGGDDQRPSDPSRSAGTGATTDRPLRGEDLVYINRMTTVGHVLPSVAHELNNSLQVIGGLVELLAMRTDLSKDALDKIQKIGLQAVRSADMIRDFVAFARRDDEASGRVEVNRALEAALELRRYHLARARIDLTVSPSPGPLVIAADSQQVTQVLLNLIINAEEALASEERRTLRISLTDGDGTVRCEVHDSGPGFADAARKQLRQPFASTKARGAAGLGLSVASMLVEQVRGRLLILDGPGGRVVVEWPKATPIRGASTG